MCPRQCAHTQAHTHRTSPRCDTQPAACATEMLYAHEFYWDRHKARSSTLVRGAVDLTMALLAAALLTMAPACAGRLQVPPLAAGRGLAYRRAAALARRHTHARGAAHAAAATAQQDGVVPRRLDHHADVRGRLLTLTLARSRSRTRTRTRTQSRSRTRSRTLTLTRCEAAFCSLMRDGAIQQPL